jgi:zinc transport system permease protein
MGSDGMLKALFEYNFLQNAFYCSILISIVCGIIGTVIILKKLAMMSGGIAHTSFGGVGLGYFLGIEPIIGAFIFAVAAAIGIGYIGKKSHRNSDIATGIFWSAGMASGILFISFTPGYPPDMSSYLFGDILTVSKTDLLLTLILDAIVVFFIIAFYNCFRAYLFDDEFAAVLKINVNLINNILHVIIALSIVILIRAVGIVLVLALLTAPAAIAKLFSGNLKIIMLLSILISLLLCFAGLWISYQFNIASGAAIALLSSLLYFAAHIFKKILKLKTGREIKNQGSRL